MAPAMGLAPPRGRYSQLLSRRPPDARESPAAGGRLGERRVSAPIVSGAPSSTRAADDREPNFIRTHLFGALFQEAFPKAGPEIRDQMLHQFCDLIRSRCTGTTDSFMDYAMDHLPPRSLLSAQEFALCEFTLEQIARTSTRVEPRFRALRALAGLQSDHALLVVEVLLGEDPSEDLVGRAFGALDGFPAALDALYSQTRHTLFHAFTDSRRVRSMTGDVLEQTSRRRLGWLRENPDARVRRVALSGLIGRIEEAFRSRSRDYESIRECTNEVLDLILRDSSREVRRLAANYLSSYSRHLGFLDSEMREKVDKLFESVRR